MVNLAHDRLSVIRQAELVGVNRTSVYRKEPAYKENEENIAIMNQIDRIHTDFPTYGYRIITRLLTNAGYQINRKRVRRLMRNMGIYAIYPKPNQDAPSRPARRNHRPAFPSSCA